MNNTRPQAASSTVHWVLMIAGAAGIVGLFLPFTEGYSPLEAARDQDLWRAAIPFFLAVPVFLASVRWIISGSLSAPERVIAYVMSASMACVTLSIFVTEPPGWPSNLWEWLIILCAPSLLTLGVFALIRNSRIETLAAFNPVMAIQTAYIAHAVMWLILASEEMRWDRGAWVVLIAVMAYVLQIILVSVQSGKRPLDHPV
jgi:hypothetical protein